MGCTLVDEVIFGAVRDLDDRNGNVSVFAELMRSCPADNGPGLLTPREDPTPDEVELKYMLLAEVMKRKPKAVPRLGE